MRFTFVVVLLCAVAIVASAATVKEKAKKPKHDTEAPTPPALKTAKKSIQKNVPKKKLESKGKFVKAIVVDKQPKAVKLEKPAEEKLVAPESKACTGAAAAPADDEQACTKKCADVANDKIAKPTKDTQPPSLKAVKKPIQKVIKKEIEPKVKMAKTMLDKEPKVAVKLEQPVRAKLVAPKTTTTKPTTTKPTTTKPTAAAGKQKLQRIKKCLVVLNETTGELVNATKPVKTGCPTKNVTRTLIKLAKPKKLKVDTNAANRSRANDVLQRIDDRDHVPTADKTFAAPHVGSEETMRAHNDNIAGAPDSAATPSAHESGTHSSHDEQ